MSKILSIIIPCYNCKQFLNKGLSSLVFKGLMDKLEVIIVNDGSTDDGEKISQSYIKKYPKTFKLVNKENGGHGSAINTGVSVATGKYIKVLDADDWVYRKDFATYIKALEYIESHVVLTHHHTIDISTNKVKKWRSYSEEYNRPFSMDEIMSQWKCFDRSLTFHGITYLRSFYTQKGIKLSEKVFYEDHEYATIPCCFAETVTPLNIYMYEYRIGDISQSVSVENQVKRISHVDTVIKRLVSERKNLDICLNTKGKRDYYLMKVHTLLLSFLVTALLGCKERNRGKTLADEMMNFIKNEYSEVYEKTLKHYKILRTLNTLHVSHSGYKRILNSKLYNKVRGNHDFK